MKCRHCESTLTRVIETRTKSYGKWRRHSCDACRFRWSTIDGKLIDDLSAEQRALIKPGHTGRPHSSDAKKKMSESQRKRWNKHEPT